jgi:NADPH2:quinone reductase
MTLALPETMRAIVMTGEGGPEVLQERDIPVPKPKPGEALFKVAYCGLNPFDAFVRGGKLSWLHMPPGTVLGTEHTGRVVAVGEGVDPAWIGRRVLRRAGFGGYAEYSATRADALIPLDDRMDFRTGCAWRGITMTAWHALFKAARFENGQTVLIHSAAGGIGIVLIQMVKSHGGRAIGLAGGADKCAFAKSFGADHVIDYTLAGWPEQVKTLTGGEGCDIIIDGNAGPNAAANIDLVAKLGTVLYIGVTAGPYPDAPSIQQLMAKSAKVGGMTLVDVEVPRGSRDERAIADEVASGRWRIPITREVELSQTAALHRALENRQIAGRAVIRIGGEQI